MSEYQPGTVAIATVMGTKGIRVFRTPGGWIAEGGSWHEDHKPISALPWVDVTDVRPLGVLDLEDYDPARIVSVLRDRADLSGMVPAKVLRFLADQIEAQNKPLRIPEPAWGEKVVAHTHGDHERRVWLRFSTDRYRIDQWVALGKTSVRWNDLIDPEGIES